ncbi:hypothetical protein LCGC14_0343110 [marine sediment metagenome]|uniref:Uncharacterized protein n=1 Tax=marine sediment metagenome TaxID=412755 RepID=A0A0F9WKU2_9ZZZZ
MPEKLSSDGTYKARATEWGVAESSTGLPQYFLDFIIHAKWNPDTEEWEDYTEMDESHSGFFCLRGKKDQELRICKQIAKIFGWEGPSFSELARIDVSEVEFQVRIEENNNPDYADKHPFKVEWLDLADAIPGSGVVVLDDSGLAALDKKYALVFKRGGTAVAAKSASAKAAPSRLKQQEPAPKEPVVVSKEQKQINMAAKAKKNRDAKEKDDKDKSDKEGGTPPARPRPGAKDKTVVTFSPLDGETAWSAICVAQAAADMDDTVAEKILYDVEVAVIGREDFDDNAFTDEQWGEIAVRTIAEIQSAS